MRVASPLPVPVSPPITSALNGTPASLASTSRTRRAACAPADEGVDRVALVLRRVLLAEPALRAGAARGAGDDEVEPLLLARLLEEVVRAEPHAAHRIGDVP